MKKDLELYFEYKCWKGFKSKNLPNSYKKRLLYEIKVIEEMGFPGYFLVVADFINWARRNDILVGSGRGSGAASLCCLCLGITRGIDPIEHGLIFERFLNPGRKSLPDLDVDFAQEDRDLVIGYLKEKYGEDRIASIGTFGTMRAKAAIQRVCSVLGLPIHTGEELRSLVLPPEHGKPQPLNECYKRVKELNEIRNSGTSKGMILRWAERFEDRIASVGVHASGLIIADSPVTDRVPLFAAKAKTATQWPMEQIEEIGLVKFDLLGLMTLSKMQTCIDLVHSRHGIQVELDNLDMNDSEVFKTIQSGELQGIFQLESSGGIRDLILKVKPNNLKDLSAIIAIYRPGPLQSEGLQDYLAWRNGAEPKYLVPEMEPILKDTGGFICYQEQILHIARELAGYTMVEADNLRKAIGKKKTDILEEEKVKFRSGWLARGLSLQDFNVFWSRLLGFADYAFNRGHSASYAVISYQTAYLKTYYPIEFLVACMIKDSDNKDQLITYIGECKRLGYSLSPPDINCSKRVFSIESDISIRFGLETIKGIGEKPVKEIITKRDKDGPYKGIEDFCERVHLGIVRKDHIQTLIEAGAFDYSGITRRSMIEWLELRWVWMKEKTVWESKNSTYNKKKKAYKQRLEEVKEGTKKKSLKEPTQPPPLRKCPSSILLDEYDLRDLLKKEYDLLGCFMSGHPLDNLVSGTLDTVSTIKELPSSSLVQLCVIPTGIKEHMTAKTKKQMAFLDLEDLTGRISCVVFPKTFEAYGKYIKPITPLLISGFTEIKSDDNDNPIVGIKATEIKPVKVPVLKKKRNNDTLRIKANQIKDLLFDSKENHKLEILYNSGMRIKIKTAISVELQDND